MFEVLMQFSEAIALIVFGLVLLWTWWKLAQAEGDRNYWAKIAAVRLDFLLGEERRAATASYEAATWKEKAEHYENVYEQCRKDLLIYKAQVENIREVLNQ